MVRFDQSEFRWLILPADLRSLPEFLEFVVQGGKDAGFSEERLWKLELASEEAVVNVIRYAYRLRDDRLISLRMEGLRKCVRMRLRDYGEKVFPHEMKGRSHDLIKPGGLGLHLIRYAFDRVDYIHKPRGTELVLTKNLA